MSRDASNEWADLGLEVDGVAVLRPSLRLEIAVPWAEGPEVLDFYRRSREALGNALTHFDTGSGNWKKINAKTDDAVQTWCTSPVPYPKKTYFCTLQGSDQGITSAALSIDFVMRPYEAPTQAMLAKWRDANFHPNLRHSFLSVSFPPDHPLAEPDRFVAWVGELSVLKRGRFISGSAGYFVDFPVNPPNAAAGAEAADRAGALLARHPGLDLANRWSGTSFLWQRDMDYLEAVGEAVAKPYLKRANWLNFLSEGQVALLGGVEKLRKTFAPLPSIRIEEWAHGILVRAGDAPQLGDITTQRIPAEYAAVAKAVAPVRLPSIDPSSMGDWFRNEGAEQWLNALENA